jgi:hypothetical protein
MEQGGDGRSLHSTHRMLLDNKKGRRKQCDANETRTTRINSRTGESVSVQEDFRRMMMTNLLLGDRCNAGVTSSIVRTR